MKDVSDIEASSRDEMRCPNCGQKSLEPHPRAKSMSSKKDSILYGTKCGNPNCAKYNERIDQSELKQQYSGSRLGGLPSKNVIITLALVVGGAFVLAQMFGVFSLGATTHTIEGNVMNPSGEPVEGATIVAGDTTAVTNASGGYSIDLEAGSYKMYVKPPENSSLGATQIYDVTVTKQGTTQFTNVKKSSPNFSLSTAFRLSASGKAGSQSTSIEFANIANAGSTKVTMVGDTSDTVTTDRTVSLPVGNSSEVNLTGNGVQNQRLLISVPLSTETVSNTYTYTGPMSVNVEGNVPPRDAVIQFGSKQSSTTESVGGRVENNRKFNINIGNDEPTEVYAVLSEGSSETEETVTGTWSGNDPTVDISESSAPASTTVTLTGSVSETQETYDGTISGNSVSFPVNGNINALNATIKFTGGTPETTQIGSSSVTATGEDGDSYHRKKIATVQSSGEYRLSTDFDIAQNSKYVSAGYLVDGKRTEVSEGQSTVTLNLDKGDTVYTWVEATSDASGGDRSFPGDGSDVVDVTGYSAEPTSVSSGDSVYVTATLRNNGNQADNIDVYLYVDGSGVLTKSYSVDAGTTREVEVGQVSFDSKSVHTVAVNDLDSTLIKVDGATVTYGEGSITSSLAKEGGEGEVSVDKDGDGTYDCTVSAESGSCSLGQIPSGENTLNVRQSGVTNTGYTVTYTARSGPKDVKLDVDNDGQFEETHSGLLSGSETLTASTTLEAGSHSINIETGSGSGVQYDISWAQAGVVSSPTIKVDGETVVDSSEDYRGEKRFSLGTLEPGGHTIEFVADSGAYTAELQWSGNPEQQYPPVIIGGQTVCTSTEVGANGGTCTIPSSQLQGDSEIEFSEQYEGKDVTLEYTSRIAPSTVSVTAGEETTELQMSDGTIKNGKWTYNESTSIFKSGTNSVLVEYTAPQQTELNPSAQLKYTAEFNGPTRPRIVVTNSQGETHTKQVPTDALNSEGVLSGKYTTSLPYEWFTQGNNTIVVESSNGVPIDVTIVSRSTIEQTISLSKETDSGSDSNNTSG